MTDELTFKIEYVRGLTAARPRANVPTTWLLRLTAEGICLTMTEQSVQGRRGRPVEETRVLREVAWDDLQWLSFGECRERGLPFATLVHIGFEDGTAVFGARPVPTEQLDEIQQATASWPGAQDRIQLFD